MKKPKPLPDLTRWWPFKRLDADTLAKLDRLAKQQQRKTQTTPEALL